MFYKFLGGTFTILLGAISTDAITQRSSNKTLLSNIDIAMNTSWQMNHEVLNSTMCKTNEFYNSNSNSNSNSKSTNMEDNQKYLQLFDEYIKAKSFLERLERQSTYVNFESSIPAVRNYVLFAPLATLHRVISEHGTSQ